MEEIIFTVEYGASTYPVYGHEWNTLESIWNCVKCWAMSGTRVKITDNSGKSKVFVKD